MTGSIGCPRRGGCGSWGGRGPEERWARPRDGRWRLVLFDVPTRQNTHCERLRRYLRDEAFGCVQNRVWITSDPLTEERQRLDGGKINVESLLLLEARPWAGDFARINRRYARHLKILDARPGGALRNDTRRWRCCDGRRYARPGWGR